jgi:RNA polymerase sigma-70 factor (ECF subfamily)
MRHGAMNEFAAIARRRHAEHRAKHRASHQEAELRVALRRYVGGQLGHADGSDDIVQETYLRLYDYRRTRPIANVGAFCFAVARNLVRDHFRRSRNAPCAGPIDEAIACPQPMADEVLDYCQRVAILVDAMKAMPPLRREVLLRRQLDGIPAATIATDLGLSRAAVDKHCTRALAHLRAALERRGLPPGARQ